MRFERSSRLDTALYKNIPFYLQVRLVSSAQKGCRDPLVAPEQPGEWDRLVDRDHRGTVDLQEAQVSGPSCGPLCGPLCGLLVDTLSEAELLKPIMTKALK